MTQAKRYKLYADSITAMHVFWSILIFAGAVAMFFWHPYALTEIVIVSFTLLISLPFGAVCPLTMMEEHLRRKIDPSFKNGGSYLAYYINKLLGADFSVGAVNIAVGIFYFFIYAAAISLMIWH
jgi:hypothetical protein